MPCQAVIVNKDYFKKRMKRYIKLTLNLSIITTASKRGVFFSIHIFRKLTMALAECARAWAPSLDEYVLIGSGGVENYLGPRRLRSAGFVQLGLGLGLTASLYLLFDRDHALSHLSPNHPHIQFSPLWRLTGRCSQSNSILPCRRPLIEALTVDSH